MIQFCERVAEGISALVDDESEAVVGLDRPSIEAHLRVCSYCSAMKHRLRKAHDVLTAPTDHAPADRPPARLWESIEDTLRREGLIRGP